LWWTICESRPSKSFSSVSLVRVDDLSRFDDPEKPLAQRESSSTSFDTKNKCSIDQDVHNFLILQIKTYM
jgi:hypothetical protein